jgi:hypothetical protein
MQYEPSNWELRAYPDRFGTEPPDGGVSIDDYTHRELVEIAQEHDVTGYSGKNKQQLFDMVSEWLE